MTDLDRGPSSDGESAICATSLNKPSSQEGLKPVEMLYAGLEALLAAVHAGDPKRELLVRVGDAMREAKSAATLISEQQAEVDRLTKRLDLLAVGFGVCDGGKYIADWQTKIAHHKRALSAESALYLEKNKSDNLEQNYHEATTRHPSFNDAIEAAYATCLMFVEEECVLDAEPDPQSVAELSMHRVGLAIRDRINCSRRSLKLPDYRGGEAKTAESEHSPSTKNAETE